MTPAAGLDPSLSRAESEGPAVFIDVDYFIDDVLKDGEADRYARFFFMLHRLPACHWAQFGEWMQGFELYATHVRTGKRWRIVGASRMGDVYVKEPASAPPGCTEWAPFYDCRGFSVSDFKEWGRFP